MTARIMERGLSSGRIDDNEEAIRKRLATYHESTMPIIKEFEARGKLREVNSDQTIGVCVRYFMYLVFIYFSAVCWLSTRPHEHVDCLVGK